MKRREILRPKRTRNRIAPVKRVTHWTVHCLGIAGLLGILLGSSALLSRAPERVDMALFNLALGMAELCLALLSVER